MLYILNYVASNQSTNVYTVKIALIYFTLLYPVALAVKAFVSFVVGASLSEIFEDFAGFWRLLVKESQLRWVCYDWTYSWSWSLFLFSYPTLYPFLSFDHFKVKTRHLGSLFQRDGILLTVLHSGYIPGCKKVEFKLFVYNIDMYFQSVLNTHWFLGFMQTS